MNTTFQLGLPLGRRSHVRISEAVKKVVVIFIRPANYHDDGFPHRYVRAVLPSNTLAVMNALTQEAFKEILPQDVSSEIHMFEDGVANHARKLHRLHRRFADSGFFAFVKRCWRRLLGKPDPEAATKLIVGFVGVQTAQFPRCVDLIDRWQQAKATCIVGGFHVTGSISTMLDGVSDANRPDIPSPHRMPAEIQAVMDRGAIVFHGEAEGILPQVLTDIIEGHPQKLYRGGMPDLSMAPLPRFAEGYFARSFATMIGTFDTSRGCPFICTFCVIPNTQGRKMRFREPQAIIEQVKSVCESMGFAAFFFTDDNFARNPRWEEILDGLVELRRRGYKIGFMIEADLACYKIPRFIPKLAAAGCTQTFMGVESLSAENLVLVNKRQNKVAGYKRLWDLCHDEDSLVHAGYIIGFPHDTRASVKRDVQTLFDLGADQASFFMLTPLPGSEDHARAVAAGVAIDLDLTRCDSFHAIVDHPLMSRDEWFASYTDAWHQFYSVPNMVAAMRRCKTRRNQMNLLRNYVWYRWAFATERTHPMIAGFYRVRDYHDRRPSAPHLSYGRFVFQEAARHLRYVRRLLVEFFIFQQVMFEVDLSPLIAEKRHELSGTLHGVGDWLSRTFGRTATREWLNAFWVDYGRKRWHLLFNPLKYYWHLAMVPHAITEVVYAIRCGMKIPRLIRTTRME